MPCAHRSRFAIEPLDVESLDIGQLDERFDDRLAEQLDVEPSSSSPVVVGYVALGGNLGDVLAQFRVALGRLDALGVQVLAVSRAYRTTAVLPDPDAPPAPDYWNAVCRVRTALPAQQLLCVLQSIEAQAGRTRHARWASRPLDLDLLLYGDAIIDVPGLRVPHPRLAERAFVLQPLLDVASEVVVPTMDTTRGGITSVANGVANGVRRAGAKGGQHGAVNGDGHGGGGYSAANGVGRGGAKDSRCGVPPRGTSVAALVAAHPRPTEGILQVLDRWLPEMSSETGTGCSQPRKSQRVVVARG